MTKNAQQIFDEVATHLFAQGVRSMAVVQGEFDRELILQCAYRGNDGCKCAVGLFIPDDKYNVMMEGLGLHTVSIQDSLKGVTDRAQHGLLSELQVLHDDESVWASTDEMRLALNKVANVYSVSSAIVSTLSFKDR